MKEFIKKIGSRKFIATLIGVITGLALAFGADESTISTVSGAVMTCVSIVSYIVVEGNIDAKAVSKDAETDPADQ